MARTTSEKRGAASAPGILFDFSGIRTGGGVQLALNFLDSVFSREWAGLKLYVVLPDTGELAHYPLKLPASHQLRCPSPVLWRVWFERTTLQRFIRENGIVVIKTLFGAGLPHGRNVTSVVGVAYPIICYPESPYWRHLPWRAALRQRIKNEARRRRLLAADHVIVETPVMQRRIAAHCRLAPGKVHVLPPAPSDYLGASPRTAADAGPVTFLFLSGASPHKNLWRLPAVAKRLLASGAARRFRFLVSCGADALAGELNGDTATAAHFDFRGAVASRDIQSLYDEAHVLVNLSDLESFSNNYMEAWKANVPLLVSDRDFAREICADSAIYCEPHDVEQIAQRMLAFVRGQVDIARLVANGAARLRRLGNQDTRMDQIRAMLLSYAADAGVRC
ncbi:glycosyltransferase family 4 protein [Paraburkholderia sp. Ac-20336]|uniref:glycosyltransferase family 4 protein n=1 Tax=Paraburkholderia sp. Ac-20336 TaxID=2703886 RepID=UPI00197EBACD|nr:glycosyltransferase family 4 protein [Paraburkholderia sp. Ac-20336]MBN3804512.1 glycosyltransferase family 4 protein [Paraburkholderia sp. Ac-20336]